jgi:hypothetical protein
MLEIQKIPIFQRISLTLNIITMKTMITYALCLLLAISSAFGQNVISGKVYDKSNGTPIANALISAKNDASMFVRTDASGHFTMSLPPEIKVIEVKAPGFKTQTEPLQGRTVFVFEMVTDPKDKSRGNVDEPSGDAAKPVDPAWGRGTGLDGKVPQAKAATGKSLSK